MPDTFITYQKFTEEALALNLVELLKKHQITFEYETSGGLFDVSFSNNDLIKEYIVKIHPSSFPKVEKLLADQATIDLENIDESHYLYAFSDEELIDLVQHKDEWNALDYNLALELLAKKGIYPDTSKIEKERLATLAKPESSQLNWIIACYCFLFIMPIIPAFSGWYLTTSKKTLPDGSRIYNYNENDRKHGRRLFVLGLIAIVLVVVYRVFI